MTNMVAHDREENDLKQQNLGLWSVVLSISRLTYLAYLIRAWFDCVKRPWSSLGRLRRYNFVKLHYTTLHMTVNCGVISWKRQRSSKGKLHDDDADDDDDDHDVIMMWS